MPASQINCLCWFILWHNILKSPKTLLHNANRWVIRNSVQRDAFHIAQHSRRHSQQSSGKVAVCASSRSFSDGNNSDSYSSQSSSSFHWAVTPPMVHHDPLFPPRLSSSLSNSLLPRWQLMNNEHNRGRGADGNFLVASAHKQMYELMEGEKFCCWG